MDIRGRENSIQGSDFFFAVDLRGRDFFGGVGLRDSEFFYKSFNGAVIFLLSIYRW